MFDLDSLNDEILKINAVQFVYVKSSYKSLTSKYEKSNSNINISKISDLPFYVKHITSKGDSDILEILILGFNFSYFDVKLL